MLAGGPRKKRTRRGRGLNWILLSFFSWGGVWGDPSVVVGRPFLTKGGPWTPDWNCCVVKGTLFFGTVSRYFSLHRKTKSICFKFPTQKNVAQFPMKLTHVSVWDKFRTMTGRHFFFFGEKWHRFILFPAVREQKMKKFVILPSFFSWEIVRCLLLLLPLSASHIHTTKNVASFSTGEKRTVG